MAMHQNEQQQQNQSFSLDALYCEEEQWEEDVEREEEERESDTYSKNETNPSPFPGILLEQDLYWEDEELLSLFSKEQEIQIQPTIEDTDSALSMARREAVNWMMKVNGHYGFTALTLILAVNYLDRFVSGLQFQKDKPWMIQLAAVACLSLAAKVEETQVPLLLDLQVEDSKYVFEAKTIQRMELMVLSALQWRMNPVTPLSFIDHIMRRLGLTSHLHWEFLQRCECLLLSVVVDSRFVGFLPSILATATMLRVIHQIEPCNSTEYQSQLLGVLKINKERVEDCYELMFGQQNDSLNLKRKYEPVPGSPRGVIGTSFGSDSSNDSWAVGSPPELASSSAPAPVEPAFKKSRAQERQMRVLVDAVGSPR
ncbi:hypothetical protein NMG60_11019734 [Bertholletia excelsa]